jgi:hypothetical protein
VLHVAASGIRGISVEICLVKHNEDPIKSPTVRCIGFKMEKKKKWMDGQTISPKKLSVFFTVGCNEKFGLSPNFSDL